MKLYEFINQPESYLVFAESIQNASKMMAEKYNQTEIEINKYDGYYRVELGYLQFEVYEYEVKKGICQ